ncbi:MAG: hypothetical protein ACRD3Y_10860, partial [Bryobacteraceae bacterium]
MKLIGIAGALALAAPFALPAQRTSAVPLHHPIATSSAAAQRAFDRGLVLVYAFNFEAAQTEFRRAAALDPSAPMPWWGLALAMGPNYNAPQSSL